MMDGVVDDSVRGSRRGDVGVAGDNVMVDCLSKKPEPREIFVKLVAFEKHLKLCERAARHAALDFDQRMVLLVA
jgi:hypothetical protein